MKSIKKICKNINPLKHKWIMANLIAVFLCLFFVFEIVGDYSDKASLAVTEGKQVILRVPTGELIAKDLEDENTLISYSDDAENEVESSALKNKDKPRLIVAIRGLGLNDPIMKVVMKLDSRIALSFSPYAKSVGLLVNKAIKAGYDTLLDLPMQTKNYPLEDSGSFSLLTHSGKAKNMFRLKSTLSVADGYLGVLSSPEEQFTYSLVSILPVIDELKNNNVMFIYNERTSNAFLSQEARAIGLSVVKSFVVIDDILSQKAIDKKLETARSDFVEKGKTVFVVGQPYPVTIKRIHKWVKKITKDGIHISKISDLLK